MKKVTDFLKKAWLFILNPLALAVLYVIVDVDAQPWVSAVIGLTLFANAAYWAYELFKK